MLLGPPTGCRCTRHSRPRCVLCAHGCAGSSQPETLPLPEPCRPRPLLRQRSRDKRLGSRRPRGARAFRHVVPGDAALQSYIREGSHIRIPQARRLRPG
eukprot:scaffold1395_cov397-Prasinococcus_capsulatus_cf.AAC.12